MTDHIAVLNVIRFLLVAAVGTCLVGAFVSITALYRVEPRRFYTGACTFLVGIVFLFSVLTLIIGA